MATIIPQSATFVNSMQLLKCQPILNHPKIFNILPLLRFCLWKQ
jgi:hypothetical protein